MAFAKVKSAKWIQPIRKGYRMACCDCGLVHSLHFRIHKGRIQFKAYRDNKNTRLLRKRDKIFVVQAPKWLTRRKSNG